MQVRTVTTTRNILTDDEGREYDLTYTPLNSDDLFIEKVEDQIAVGYLVVDEYPGITDYFSDYENGEFHEFRSRDEMEKIIEELEVEKKNYFLVDKYEHGLVHYSVANTSNYPDRRWDVSCCAIFVVPEDVSKERAVDYANAVLQEYTDWCNGQVFGVCLDIFNKTGNKVDDNACWGYIGYDHALESLKEEIKFWSE